jgi:hypothetical protein
MVSGSSRETPDPCAPGAPFGSRIRDSSRFETTVFRDLRPGFGILDLGSRLFGLVFKGLGSRIQG